MTNICRHDQSYLWKSFSGQWKSFSRSNGTEKEASMKNIVLIMMMSFVERDSKKIELAVWGSIREMQATQICPRTFLPPRGPRFIGGCPGGACLLFPNALVSHILVGIELLLQVAAALRKSAKGLNQIVRHGLVPDCSRLFIRLSRIF